MMGFFSLDLFLELGTGTSPLECAGLDRFMKKKIIFNFKEVVQF